jgi:hypothetical protein
MTDLAANSRFPLVISRQDVTSLFCVDAAWVEPVTFSGVRQKFAAPVVPSPLRLLLPRTSLIVESSVYVVRASSLKVIMALPFFMQLKEYFANVLLHFGFLKIFCSFYLICQFRKFYWKLDCRYFLPMDYLVPSHPI